mmetsp:Transcript_77210/g.221958  ORF Transcript_77210/g.221958 Transcript_77210/m.221958 type:complete len:233 (+) Transcript_77210:2128-2826(+)
MITLGPLNHLNLSQPGSIAAYGFCSLSAPIPPMATPAAASVDAVSVAVVADFRCAFATEPMVSMSVIFALTWPLDFFCFFGFVEPLEPLDAFFAEVGPWYPAGEVRLMYSLTKAACRFCSSGSAGRPSFASRSSKRFIIFWYLRSRATSVSRVSSNFSCSICFTSSSFLFSSSPRLRFFTRISIAASASRRVSAVSFADPAASRPFLRAVSSAMACVAAVMAVVAAATSASS